MQTQPAKIHFHSISLKSFFSPSLFVAYICFFFFSCFSSDLGIYLVIYLVGTHFQILNVDLNYYLNVSENITNGDNTTTPVEYRGRWSSSVILLLQSFVILRFRLYQHSHQTPVFVPAASSAVAFERSARSRIAQPPCQITGNDSRCHRLMIRLLINNRVSHLEKKCIFKKKLQKRRNNFTLFNKKNFLPEGSAFRSAVRSNRISNFYRTSTFRSIAG